MPIKCGNCKQYHPNVQAVRGCHLAAGLIETPHWGQPFTESKQTSEAEIKEIQKLLEPYPVYQAILDNDPSLAEEPEVRRRGESFLGLLDETHAPEKVYLNVPFIEKDRAKKFGAKFDWNNKKWWVSGDTDLSALPKGWLTESVTPTITEDGFYVLNGETFKVQQNQTGTKLYAKRLVELFPENLKRSLNPKKAIYEWCRENGVAKPARWEYEHGLIWRIGEAEKLNEADATMYGQLYGICRICGALLTNEDSIERGIGPICAGKLA